MMKSLTVPLNVVTIVTIAHKKMVKKKSGVLSVVMTEKVIPTDGLLMMKVTVLNVLKVALTVQMMLKFVMNVWMVIILMVMNVLNV